MKRRWPLSNAQVTFVATTASTASSVATLNPGALWVRVVAGVVVGLLISLSVYVWRRVREPLGYFTTWAIEALLWGAVLGVVTGVSAVIDNSGDVWREVVLGAGSGVLMVAGWAALIIPGRGFVKGVRALVRRRRVRSGKTGSKTGPKTGPKTGSKGAQKKPVKQSTGGKHSAPRGAEKATGPTSRSAKASSRKAKP